MFDHTSRYASLDTETMVLPDGRPVAFVRRRFPPQARDLKILAEVAVAPGERIDLLANRIYGDPLAFWRLCDGNDALDPLEMVETAAADPSRRLRAPMPTAG